MADQDFNIKVVTTADTSGIKDTEAALSRLSSGRGFPTAGQLGPGFIGEAPEALKDGAESTKEIAEESLLAGANMTRLRQESVIFARELATGVPTTRTLSSLIGAIMQGLHGGALAGLGIVGAEVAAIAAAKIYIDHQQKVNSELDVQLTKLTESAQKWKEIAVGATSFEDVDKVVSAVIPALDAAQSKFRDFQNQGITFFQDLLDSFVKIPGISGGIFDKLFRDQASRLAQNVALEKQQGEAARSLAQEYDNAFDKKRIEPLQQAIKELTSDIEKHQNAAKNTKDLETYQAETAIVRSLKNELSELINLQAKQRSEADAAAKPLAGALATPTGQYLQKEREEMGKHEEYRAALEQKRREAVASGDTARARAITDELKDDKFARDQRKESLQKFVADQESISGGAAADQQTRLKALGPEGLGRYDEANRQLSEIYGQQKGEAGKDNSGDILATLRAILDTWR